MKTKIIFVLLIISFLNIHPVLAVSSFGYYNPLSLEFPGRVNPDGITADYAFIIANGSIIGEYGNYANGVFDDNTGNFRVIGGGSKLVYAIADWTTPGQIFFVDSDKKVGRISTLGQVNYSLGWFDSGFGGCALGGNCNPMHQIGTLSTLNTQVSGLVDSFGNLYLSDGTTIVKFDASIEYSQSTYLTLTNAVDYSVGGSQICDLKYDSNGNIHVLVNVPGASSSTSNLWHDVFQGTTRLKSTVLYSLTDTAPRNKMLVDTNASSNKTSNLTYVLFHSGNVNLYHYNGTAVDATICSPCSGITDFDGMSVLGIYVYMASSAQNKIYRFPTSYNSSSGTGFVPGTPTTGTQLTYISSTIYSLYPTYYNNSNFQIGYNLSYQSTGEQLNEIGHRVDLIDTNSADIQSYTIVPTCSIQIILTPPFLTWSCTASKTFSFTSAIPWTNGTYHAYLYEVNSSSGISALVNSASFIVLNQTKPATGTAPGGTGSQPNQPISSQAIVDLLTNNTFWALIFTAGFMVATGVFAGKAKTNPILPMIMIGFLSIAVFTMLGWLPLWILFSIILVVIVAFAWQQARNMNVGSQ